MPKIHDVYNQISNSLIQDKGANARFSKHRQQIVGLLMQGMAATDSIAKVVDPSISSADSPINLDTMISCFIGIDFAQRHADGADSHAIFEVIDVFLEESLANDEVEKYYYDCMINMIKRNMRHIPVVMDLVEQLTAANRAASGSFMNSILNAFIGGVCMGTAIKEVEKMPKTELKYFKRYMDYLEEWSLNTIK
jgi:hypothetical protein